MPLDRLTKLDPLQLGRFTILARLGAGGMGNVYLAEADDGTPAAVKVIRAELAKDPQFRARFRREVEAGRRAQNRCIARYLDADTYAAAPWLATEFVPGPTLHHEVHANGPVIGPPILGLGAGLADALVAIHAAGLVHRDLKPANVLLAPDAPKVIDFGISLAADATVLTTTGTLVGSPAYMSPEQARGIRDVGPAADVFSWASCMAFASRGDPPFGEGEAAGLLYKVVHEIPDLTGVAPALAPFLSAALDKDPDNRPTALELVAGLTAVLDGTPPASLLAPPAGGGTSRLLASTAGANAGRVLAATWAADLAVVEEAELVMAEARKLRASLPPRAEERSRRDRLRAKRAVFLAMLAAVVALLVVAFATVRPGQVDDAKPAGLGTPRDSQPPPSTVQTVDGSAAPGQAAAPTTAVPAYGPDGTTTVPAAAAGQTPTTLAPGGAPPPPPPPSSGPTVVAGPITTSRAMTCTVQVVDGPTADRLPQLAPYRLRITASSSYSTASVVLVRRGQQPRPREAWVKQPLGAAAAGESVVIESFSMQPLQPGSPSETRYETPIVHYEPLAPTPIFDVQLRANGQAPTCGTLSG